MGLSIHFNGEKIFLNGAEIKSYIHMDFFPLWPPHGHPCTCCLPVSSEESSSISTLCTKMLPHPIFAQICPENVSFKERNALFYALNNFYPGLWLKNRKKAYIFWKNPLQKNMMCMEGRHCSCFISVPCTGVSWDGTLKPANCSFSLIDYPAEIQSPWQTRQRTTMFEHITAHSEKSGVQTVIFQSTVIWLQSC